MRYGIIPTRMIERIGLACGRVPVPLVDAVFGPLKARAIMAGVSLGVFEALRDGEHTAAALAWELGLDADALTLLLRALVVCDYLEQRGDRFVLAPLARRSMIAGAPMEMVGYLRFNYAQWEFMAHLEELVRSGRGRDFHATMTDASQWRAYQQGMLEIARIEATLVAARVPVPRGATSLLDVAGAHGLFGAAICRRNPPMRCTVLDLPQAIAHARALAEYEHLGDVVTHRAGELLTTQLGTHDVVLLFNILHHFGREQLVSILTRVRDALREGGTVAIWEIEAPCRRASAGSGDAAALFFRLTSTAGAYSADDYARGLSEAGFVRIRVTRPVITPGKMLVTARR